MSVPNVLQEGSMQLRTRVWRDPGLWPLPCHGLGHLGGRRPVKFAWMRMNESGVRVAVVERTSLSLSFVSWFSAPRFMSRAEA